MLHLHMRCTLGLINEYAKLSKQGTAGHLHFSFQEKELDQVYNAYANATQEKQS